MIKGLYTPSLEHDSCGIGCIAHIHGEKSHSVVQDALSMLANMEHRGGTGSDPDSGDGAGILFQKPHAFFKALDLGFEIPEFGQYGVGMIFLPRVKAVRNACKALLQEIAREMNFEVLGFRQVPVDNTIPGSESRKVEPIIEQVFLKHGEAEGEPLERKLFLLRSYVSHRINDEVIGSNGEFYFSSLSHRTIIYKGQLRTDQLRSYYLDLAHEKLESALAVVHSRFSTNTFPNWKLAQPFRYLSHNGEINTIKGNVTKMQSKEAIMKSKFFSDEELRKILPVTDPVNSDSANLDSLVEMLTINGRSLPHVMMMLVPEAWQDNRLMGTERKAFYKYQASLMEPWDGPAALIFSDGNSVGATLDRNGLRPARYCITKDQRLVISSEAGALQVDPANIEKNGRIQPGKMLLADLKKKTILYDDEIKEAVTKQQPYGEWIKEHRVKLRKLPAVKGAEYETGEALLMRQRACGYSTEDLKLILKPMAEKATEPIGSMGADTPIAILSNQSQHIANYFKQLFAQVSNPPIDPIRERMVMSLFTRVGESLNILEETPEHTKQLHISQPVLLNEDLEKFKNLEEIGFDYGVLDSTFNADGKPGRLEQGLDELCEMAIREIKAGKKVLIISDKAVNKDRAPVPSLIATGAVHHYLVKNKLRTKVGLIVEGGDVWETHHFATIIGYGASAVNPYLAIATLKQLHDEGNLEQSVDLEQALSNYQKAIGYGLLKILSKIGISTLQSYQAAQIFEALGISKRVVDRCFTGTISRIEGLDFDGLAREVLVKHATAYPLIKDKLEVGGVYQWRLRGEKHLFNPDTIHYLQHATRTNDYTIYKKYATSINRQLDDILTIRGLLEFRNRAPIPLEEVEPVEDIFKRFSTGAMSFGSISHEAHSTLAIAMNRIGAKSNSGEGGEDEVRFTLKPSGDSERSAIKQVASGRFGVTSNYLTNADELQIKIAQGAKPGEGGQLPGHKVDDWIGRVRHATPGVGLISPPPHHDIYSIEDLSQLIYDLKNANRKARINVKLVSEAGVGTVAAGVSKANADVVLISGADGGTGASPISSIRHAGLPWELGLAEAHQTLVKNNLRNRITVQTDGQIRTGRDLAIATLLGAEEWGISTAALVVEGCIMMRKCHLNTCPVGIATQDPELRKLFTGNPDHVVNFFTFLAQDLREIMASLGFRSINEMVGKTEVLKIRNNIDHWKLKDLDLTPILYKEHTPDQIGTFKQIDQEHGLERVLDRALIKEAQEAIHQHKPVSASFAIKNTDRAVGAMLSNEISKLHGSAGLEPGTINFDFKGSAGQTFGGFLAPGVSFTLNGEANDYFGKGLSGGELIIRPHERATFNAYKNIIIGNVAFYGATSGSAFINGLAGERFAVRNSGAELVVEGVGDHACEYMTGGRVIILGKTGKNFAAGMSGGIAYIFDKLSAFKKRCNPSMVSIEKPNEADLEYVKKMLRLQLEKTDSATAEVLLSSWENSVDNLIKVIPHEYKLIMEKQQRTATAKVI